MIKKLLIACFVVAQCFQGWGQESFYRLDSIQDIHIQFQREDWAAALDSIKHAEEEDRLPADIEIDGHRYEKVGVRYKGNSSYHNPIQTGAVKLPFNIKIDYHDDDLQLPGEIEKIKLSNVFRDPTYLREILAYDLARKYMPAPRANFARVYCNGEYMGLYHNTEAIDDEFIERHFPDDEGAFFKCDPIWKFQRPESCPAARFSTLKYLGDDSTCYQGLYELKSDAGWSELLRLTRTLENHPDSLESLLNIDQTLWMLAFNNVIVNLDSYSGKLCHNYYLYQDRNGIFHPLVWDMNLAFGGFRHTGAGGALSNEELQQLSPFLHFNNEQRPLISQLLKQPLYRKIYLAHLKTILEENFSNGLFYEQARAICDMIAPDVAADPHKLYSLDEFRANLDTTTQAGKAMIIGLSELMKGREAYLSEHQLLAGKNPQITSVSHKRSGADIRFQAFAQETEKIWLFYRQAGDGPFHRKPLDFVAATEEIAAHWEATVSTLGSLDYYLVAEGKRIAALSPARAAHEFHTVE